VSDEASRTRKTVLYQHILDLSVKLAEFITKHYCPKSMKRDSIENFYLFSSVVVDSILEGVGLTDKLREMDMLDYVKEKILGKKVEPRVFRMYVPTLADVTRLVWTSYRDFIDECLVEERMIEEAEEGEKAVEKTEKKTGKKTKKKSEKEKSGG
jgi:hypothetical protein